MKALAVAFTGRCEIATKHSEESVMVDKLKPATYKEQ
jgi:hypothetical protein